MKSILFISHDGNRAGAQILLLDAMLFLKKKGYTINLLILETYGDLFDEYEDQFNIVKLPIFEDNAGFKGIFLRKTKEQAAQEFIIREFDGLSIDLIYANTIAVSHIAPKIKTWINKPLIAHIHEMEYSIQMYSQRDDSEYFLQCADKIIACSESVKNNLLDKFKELDNKIEVVYSFVNNEEVLNIHEDSNQIKTKSVFNLPTDKVIIGGCGNAEWRKGVDLFLQIVQKVSLGKLKDKVHFVWIGIQEKGDFYAQIKFDTKRMGIEEYISLLPPTTRAKEVINTFDIFLLSSREDPFPLVMLEAALCEIPIIGFENAGGCNEFISGEQNGLVATYGCIDAISDKITRLVEDTSLREEMGKQAQQKVLNNYSYDISMNEIETILDSI